VDASDRFQKAEEFRKALLSASSKTQRLIEDDFTVPPSPSSPPPSIEKIPENIEGNSENTPPSVGVPLKSQPISETPAGETKAQRKKRRKTRWRFIRFLLYMILFAGGITALAYYSSQIVPVLSSLGIIPAAPVSVVTLTATPIEIESTISETESATAIATLEPVATDTPTPKFTSTPMPTDTPTLSPTPFGGGTGQLAFVSNRTGTSQIYLINSDGSDEHPITNLSEGACQPDWDPKGEKIVFASPCEVDRDILTGASLYIANADGTNLIQLPSAPGGDFEPAWSPDGTRIAFTSIRDGYMQVYAINLDDNSLQRLTETNRSNSEYARQPAWSPFGNQIAYAVRRYSAYQIWTMTDTGESQEQVTQSGYSLWDMHPIWSPDGASILYDQHSPNTPLRVWLMSIRYEDRGGEGVDAGINPLPVQNVDYSEDGFWLAFEGEEEEYNRDVFLMTVVGASRTRLTSDPADDYDPVWRPNP